MSRPRKSRVLRCPLTYALIFAFLFGLAVPASTHAQDTPHKIYLPLMAGAAAAAPPPAPPPGEEVSARGVSGYYDLGDYILFGEVVNNSDQPVYNVELAVTYYDAGGKVLATDTAAASLSRVEPQGASPFRDPHFGAPAGIARVDVTVESYTEESLIDYRPLTILSTNQRTGAAGVVVTGTFRNDTPAPLSNVLLVASFRNSQGEVVSVLFDYPLIGDLQPGVTMEYTVETFDDTLADTTATIQGEGSIEP
jgi:hypothetical protein